MSEIESSAIHDLVRAAQSLADVIVTVDEDSRIVYITPSCRTVLGYEPEELIGESLARIVPSHLQERHLEGFRRYLATGARRLSWTAMELPLQRRDGSAVPAEISFGEYATDGQRYFTGVIRDISNRKREVDALAASARAYRQLFEHNVAGVYRVGPDGAILDVNEAMARMLGYDREELLHLSAADLYPDPRDRDEWVREMREKGSLTNHVLRLRHRDGHTVWTLENAALVPDPETGQPSIVGTAIDISERKRLEEDLLRLAFRDPLTGLANRRLLQEMTAKAIVRAKRESGHIAMLVLDVVRFKRVNDALGHTAGDQVLIEIGERLQARVRASDTVARVGGDEFAILLVRVTRPEDADAAALGIKECFSAPFHVAGETFHIDARLGIALCPDHGSRFDELLTLADLAMYQSAIEENGIALYRPTSGRPLREDLWIEEDLRRAFDHGEFTLYYQPICRLPERTPLAHEALLRWHHPARGLLAAADFIATAERVGLIRQIDRWVMRETIRQARTWSSDGPEWIAINVSPGMLEDPHFLPFVEGTLAEEGVASDRLAIEITERTTMRDPERSLRTLRGLRELGVKIVIDDFGRGHSSLAYLIDYPADYVKVDRVFIAQVGQRESHGRLVEGIMGLCRGLELPVIAEGVDSPGQLTWLEDHGFQFAQGVLLGPPEPSVRVDSARPEMRQAEGA